MENRGLIPHMIPIILLHLKVSGNIIFTIIPHKISSIATVVIFLFLFFSVPEDAD
jgi:hypothetical protein